MITYYPTLKQLTLRRLLEPKLCTLTDANFLGYGCVLVEDCCATSSPAFCTEATMWNVKKCFGFVTRADDVIAGLAGYASHGEPR